MGQSLSNILVHVVFSTKNRMPLISASLERELHAYLGGAMKAMGCPTLGINGVQDHVHLLVVLSKTVALADLLARAKANSSRWAKQKGARGFAWQDGYAAFSIGESGVPATLRYIAEQKERHRKIGYQDELRQFLKKYRVEYDERYVWD